MTDEDMIQRISELERQVSILARKIAGIENPNTQCWRHSDKAIESFRKASPEKATGNGCPLCRLAESISRRA